MTPEQLQTWMAQMGIQHRNAAAKLLGIDKDRMGRLLDGGVPIPDYIALACTALAEGLAPYAGGRAKTDPRKKSLKTALRAFIRSASALERHL